MSRCSRNQASGDLRDSRAVQEFYRQCHSLIASEPQRAVLNLSNVAAVDTKLVARLSRIARVPLRILASENLREWIAVCRVEPLLRPYLPPWLWRSLLGRNGAIRLGKMMAKRPSCILPRLPWFLQAPRRSRICREIPHDGKLDPAISLPPTVPRSTKGTVSSSMPSPEISSESPKNNERDIRDDGDAKQVRCSSRARRNDRPMPLRPSVDSASSSRTAPR